MGGGEDSISERNRGTFWMLSTEATMRQKSQHWRGKRCNAALSEGADFPVRVRSA